VQQEKRLDAVDKFAVVLGVPDSRRDFFKQMVIDFLEADELAANAGVGVRLLRELLPSQLAAVLQDSRLGRLLDRCEKGLAELAIPSDGFKTKQDCGFRRFRRALGEASAIQRGKVPSR
jgi:hypothetical protein